MFGHPEELIGNTIGNYQVIEYIGAGALSQVYKGHHHHLDRMVAIKVLDSQFLLDKIFIEQFTQEARRLASLAHPNIVQVFDFDIKPDMIYMVMEYLEGDSLKRVINKSRLQEQAISLKRATKIMASLCHAVSYAHKQNVIHRDIKPSNVLIENSGRVVLVDFGFAKQITGNTQIHTSTLRGTPAYMAPEQTQGYPARGPADIYALGVTYFEMVTGQLPYHDDNPLSLAVKHLQEETPRPRNINREVSHQMENVILKAMAKSQSDRFSTVDDLLYAIEGLEESKTDHLPTATLSLPYLEDTKPQPKPISKMRLSLHFMETGQILDLPERNEFTIGRSQPGMDSAPDIDLTPYEGHKWGISRMHAKLQIEESAVSIVDLKSTNGTWFGPSRISADMPYRVHHGDVFRLGKLKIQLLVYQDRGEAP